ncbi:MAG: ATP-binding cassette domain-containing protein [Kineosporiaceae bacterium]|nr:ATP-binding cassette domain-containing protein [Kineosporiaceae bacterium]
MTAAQLTARAVGVRASNRVLLDGVDLRVTGGVTAVLGPNGSGKSTLVRCLATVLAPTTGEVTIDGLHPGREVERIEIRRRLGYLPQDVGVARGARVFDTVEYLAVLKGMTHDRGRRAAVFSVLDRVGLRARAGSPIEQLSGGERRRMGVAQALLGEPGLLLFDEPTAGLDPDERARFLALVHERRGRSTVVMSTHLADEAATADRVLVLLAGRVVFDGPPAALAARAAGRAWLDPGPPPAGGWPPGRVRAFRQRADGGYRCLGTPPAGAVLDGPTVEDGYLLLASTDR